MKDTISIINLSFFLLLLMQALLYRYSSSNYFLNHYHFVFSPFPRHQLTISAIIKTITLAPNLVFLVVSLVGIYFFVPYSSLNELFLFYLSYFVHYLTVISTFVVVTTLFKSSRELLKNIGNIAVSYMALIQISILSLNFDEFDFVFWLNPLLGASYNLFNSNLQSTIILAVYSITLILTSSRYMKEWPTS